MNKETILTVRWNNMLSVLLGIPLAAVVAIFIFTSAMSDRAGFIWMTVIGMLY